MSLPTNVVNSSIKVDTSYTERVSLGLVSSSTVFSVRGSNTDIDTAATEQINPTGLTIVLPTSAFTAVLVSTSANDTAAGTGARTIFLEGLNASYVVTTETMTLNGLTTVNSANTYIRLRRATVATSGTGTTNAGQITVSLNGNVQQIIAVGISVSECINYTVPAGKTAILKKFRANSIRPGAGVPVLVLNIYQLPFGASTTIRILQAILDTTTTSDYESDFEYSITLSQKSDFYVTGTTSLNNTTAYIICTFLEIDSTLI